MKRYNKVLQIVNEYIPSTTSNYELDEYGYKLLKNYVGTYPSDKIPNLKNGECCIVNLDKSGMAGSHWTAIYHYKKNNYFYDSFGRRSITILNIETVEDPDYDAEQDINELNCGARSLSFLWCFENYGKDYAMTI